MSAPGRPKRELLPLGGKARSAKGALMTSYREVVCSETRRAMMMAG